jgi:hypothetical protein
VSLALPTSFALHSVVQTLMTFSALALTDPMSGPGAVASSNPYTPQKKKSNRKKWIIGGIILAVIVILGAVLGGVLGSRAGGDDDNNTSSSGSTQGGGNNNGAADPSSGGNAGTGNAGQTAADGNAYLAISTDANSLPVYPTAVSSGFANPRPGPLR